MLAALRALGCWRPALGGAFGNRMHPSASTERAYGFMLKPRASLTSVLFSLWILYFHVCVFLKHGSCVKYSVLVLHQLPSFLVLGAVSITHLHFWKLDPSGSGTNSSHRLWSLVPVKLLSRVQLFVTPWTAAYQAPPSMEFSRQEYWSGLPFPSPGDLPDPGITPRSPTLQAGALPSELPGKP